MEYPGSSRTAQFSRLNNVHSLSNAQLPKLPSQRKMSPHMALAVHDRRKHKTVVPEGDSG